MDLDDFLSHIQGRVFWILSDVPDSSLLGKLIEFERRQKEPAEIVRWIVPGLSEGEFNDEGPQI